MADTKVTNETNIEPLNGAEEVYVVRNGIIDGKASTEAIAQTVFYDLAAVDPQAANRPWIDDGHLAVSGARSHTPAGDGWVENTQPGTHGGNAATYNIIFNRQPADGEVLAFGGKTYTFQTTLTDGDGHIQIGATLQDTIDNLAMAFNVSGTPNVNYGNGTTQNPYVNTIVTPAGAITGLFKWGAQYNAITITGSAGLIASATNSSDGQDAVVFAHFAKYRSIFGWNGIVGGQFITIEGSGQGAAYVAFDRSGALTTFDTGMATSPYTCDLAVVFFSSSGAITSISETRAMLTAPPPIIRSAVIAGGAAGGLPLRPGHFEVFGSYSQLRSVIQYVGAGVAVTDVVDITSQCQILIDDTLTTAIDTTGSKLHVIWEINARSD